MKLSATVYPRVLGERPDAQASETPPCGLSPCARGTHTAGYGSRKVDRFIPVCSGNAHYTTLINNFCSVYPRVLGERSCIVTISARLSGLSPCARGTPSISTKTDNV